tara:strand:+ start:277 stop:708 length:432 start_codon:yes stop_codon:yes gene_type:complete
MAADKASVEQLKLLVRNTLLDNSTLTTLVSSRIHGAHIQTPDEGTVDFPLVIIDFSAGFVDQPGAYQLVTMDLWAYTKSSSGEALAIYDACFDALHMQTLRQTNVKAAGYSRESLRPREGWNEQLRAYYAQGEFAIRAAYRGS